MRGGLLFLAIVRGRRSVAKAEVSAMDVLRLASAAALFLASALVSSAVAQCWTGGGSVALTINGLSPGAVDPVGHVVTLPPAATTFSFAVSGPSGIPFAMLGAPAISCAAVTIPGVAGAIDMAFPFIILNGIAPATPFDFLARTSFAASAFIAPACTGAAAAPALQAIALDFTVAPLPYTITEAGQAVRLSPPAVPVVTNYPSIGSGTFVQHTLICNTVTYAGTAFSNLFIGAGGLVTFTLGSGDFSPTPAEHFDDFGLSVPGPNPGVAVLWADYASVTTDNIQVTEDGVTGTVKVEYQNQVRWDTLTPCGTFSVTFGTIGADSLTFDLTGYIVAGGTAVDRSPIVGVSDGTSAAGGVDTTLDLSASLGYASAGGPESIMEQFRAGGSTMDLTGAPLTFLHLGGFTWTFF
jgi:hypothetical protein